VAAVESAITYLTELTPVSNLTYEVGMSNACKDHVLDLSPTSTTGNTGTDDSTPAQRVDKWGLATVVD
jgi:uncharacterized protein YkwD